MPAVTCADFQSLHRDRFHKLHISRPLHAQGSIRAGNGIGNVNGSSFNTAAIIVGEGIPCGAHAEIARPGDALGCRCRIINGAAGAKANDAASRVVHENSPREIRHVARKVNLFVGCGAGLGERAVSRHSPGKSQR